MEMISAHFSMHEALYLPSWSREATAEDGLTDEIINNLKDVFAKMDQVRDHFNKPIRVHVAYRPAAYNKQIGGATHSAHIQGKAVDFDVVGMDCEAVRQEILKSGLLEKLNLRMEDNGTDASWVHLGNDYVEGHNRFFKP